MLKFIIDFQELGAKSKQGNSETMKELIQRLNTENTELLRRQKELRKEVDLRFADLLLKDQVIEETKVIHLSEVQNLESEFVALQYKYDRKELIMQNLERKLNYYEMYITKQASKYGKNDKEADILIKKFRHDVFSGDIQCNDLHKMYQQDATKLSNIVQENIELKKQNEDLKTIIDELGYIKSIHMQLIERCKKSIQANETKKRQI